MVGNNFYKSILAIALPVTLQNLITFAISMMDTVMVGRLGEVQLSAVSLANQLFFVFTVLNFGIASGANVLLSQYWGKGDREAMPKVYTIAYRFSLSAGVIFSVLAIIFPGFVMSLFAKEQEVIQEGIKYLRIVGFSYILYGVCNVTTLMLRSVGAVRISIVIYGVSLFANTFLNWVFIFGKLGFPAMGVQGAALATLLCRIIEFSIVVTYMVKCDDIIRYKFAYLFKKSKDILDSFVKNAVPVLGNELLWAIGAATVAGIIGKMGKEFAAANSICTVIIQLVTVAIFGLGSATAVIIGKTVGEGDYEGARKKGKACMLVGMALGVLSAIFMYFVSPYVINFYEVSITAKQYAQQIMNVGCFVVIFQSLAIVSMIGVLRGGGDTKFVLIIDVIFMWLISIPLGFVAGIVIGLPVPIVYGVLKFDEALKSVFSVSRVFGGKWVKDITT